MHLCLSITSWGREVRVQQLFVSSSVPSFHKAFPARCMRSAAATCSRPGLLGCPTFRTRTRHHPREAAADDCHVATERIMSASRIVCGLSLCTGTASRAAQGERHPLRRCTGLVPAVSPTVGHPVGHSPIPVARELRLISLLTAFCPPPRYRCCRRPNQTPRGMPRARLNAAKCASLDDSDTLTMRAHAVARQPGSDGMAGRAGVGSGQRWSQSPPPSPVDETESPAPLATTPVSDLPRATKVAGELPSK